MPPAATREEELAQGLVPPPAGEQPVDPETKLTKLPTKKTGIMRRVMELSEAQAAEISELMTTIVDESSRNMSHLRTKLRRYNDMLENVKADKNFPWKDASNLNIPLTEIHMMILHSSITATVLDNDPIWYCRTMLFGNPGADDVDPNIEWFLNWVCKVQLKLDAALSEVYWNALRDPLAIGCLDWVDEVGKQRDIRSFEDDPEQPPAPPPQPGQPPMPPQPPPMRAVDKFTAEFPSPEDAGISEEAYGAMVEQASADGVLQIEVEQYITKYRGPKLRIVELKNLVLYPATAPSFEYAQFVGDEFLQRKAFYEKRAKLKWYNADAVAKMTEAPATNDAIDDVARSQDRNEGLSRSRTKPDEYKCVQGVLRYDFKKKGEEDMFLVTFNRESKKILRFEKFPYIHNRCNYIDFRIQKRSNRLLGRCIPEKLEDINDEVSTQHNQRIDSRTISTVPSFKRKENVEFDPRLAQKFYPGVTFQVRAMDDLNQFEIKQTDLGTSLQEENTLFTIAEQLTGASMLKSGRETPKDPRSPAKKVAYLLRQSDIRIDDYIKELKVGTNEFAAQIMELYYQFAPEVVKFQIQNPDTQQWLDAEIKRTKLRNNNMSIDIAHSTVNDNPENTAQRVLIEYQILSKEPLIANNIQRRYALVRDLVVALRKRNVNALIPPLKQMLQEVNDQNVLSNQLAPGTLQQLLANVMGSDKGGGPNGKRQGGPDVSVGNMGDAA